MLIKQKYRELWFDFAKRVAELSYADRLKVGCVLVSPDGERCLSFGYNGTYRGGPNSYPDVVPGDKRFIHAEINSLVKPRPNEPFSAIITHTPCLPCAIALINARAVEVYALERYRDREGWDLLSQVMRDKAHLLAEPKEFVLDGTNIVDEETFYDEIAKACSFPSYFGRNLDAVNDCLWDLSQFYPGSSIVWLNVHPYLRFVAERFKETGEYEKTLLDHMKELCEGHGLVFKA